jgi:prepilin-type N-terminal cleavage/methylation domain-containing protein
MAGRDRSRQRGLSLVEVLFAMGILAMTMLAASRESGDSMARTVEVINLTNAIQLVEGVVLDIEEEYRLEGFPENELRARRCKIPRDFDRLFRCEFDLLQLDVASRLGDLSETAGDNVESSPLMQAFCSGGPAGGMPVDPAMALATLMNDPAAMSGGLSAFAALMDPGFMQICGVDVSRMCMNTQMITGFIPMIIEQAAKLTRKLIVRITWQDKESVSDMLQIQTFITATPDAEVDGARP